jgi:hypothetical protein
MSVLSTIPKGSKLVIVGGIFKAVFGNPTIGKYDFTNYKTGGNRFNVAVPLGLYMNPNYLYFFHQMNFSLSIDEADFLTAIEPATVPTMTIRDSTTRKNIFHAPFRLFRYFENAAVDSYHFNLNANAILNADFQAVLFQVPNIIGITDLYAQVSFSVYEIADESFIREYKREVGN